MKTMAGPFMVHLVAYIDAGTGSYILAAIASGAAGLWMFFRSGLSRIRRKLRGEPAYDVEIDEVLDDSVDPEESRTRD